MPGVGGGVVFDGYGGAINRIGATDTTFVHRSAEACAQVFDHLRHGAPIDDDGFHGASLVVRSALGVRPSSSGSYQNYIDPTLHDWQRAYYGANLPRLQRIKQRRDPDDLFHFAQSIPLPA